MVQGRDSEAEMKGGRLEVKIGMKGIGTRRRQGDMKGKSKRYAERWRAEGRKKNRLLRTGG